MSELREAAEKAIVEFDSIESGFPLNYSVVVDLRQALESNKQEHVRELTKGESDIMDTALQKSVKIIARPAPTKKITDDEIIDLFLMCRNRMFETEQSWYIAFARSIEAKVRCE